MAKSIREGMTLAVYLRIENPLVMEDAGVWPPFEIAQAAGLSQPGIDAVFAQDDLGEKYERLRQALEAQGYDGIRYVNQVEAPGSVSWVAFRPTQVKAAVGNLGTFDRNNSSIFDAPVGFAQGGLLSRESIIGYERRQESAVNCRPNPPTLGG